MLTEKDQIDGYLSKTEVENVFWDSENDMVLLSDADKALPAHLAQVQCRILVL
jgi:hypothetical protein